MESSQDGKSIGSLAFGILPLGCAGLVGSMICSRFGWVLNLSIAIALSAFRISIGEGIAVF
ncbi:hypothetical protein GOP47_0012349 [Adiantum capillus-veneris]|uniref:Uncharacterized protein n=1 Tax=Adiantum capillus-veneris TaxID=13818 RepID=A0A9D4URW1_ADICA|nr:hypothetical protein GOP47_0012349 [Adiantum capillus-veneris]